MLEPDHCKASWFYYECIMFQVALGICVTLNHWQVKQRALQFMAKHLLVWYDFSIEYKTKFCKLSVLVQGWPICTCTMCQTFQEI